MYALACQVPVCSLQLGERGNRTILAAPCPAHPLSRVTANVVSTVDSKPGVDIGGGVSTMSGCSAALAVDSTSTGLCRRTVQTLQVCFRR